MFSNIDMNDIENIPSTNETIVYLNYYQRNKEKILARRKIYVAENYEKVLENNKKYYNKDYFRDYYHKTKPVVIKAAD